MVILGDIIPFQSLDPISWHMHEMLFGYAAAVICGFLLTAAQNWTGLKTLKGGTLQAMVVLWVLGRIGMVLGDSSNLWMFDLLFFPALAIVILRTLLKAGNKKNLPIVLILVLFSFVNIAFHLSVLGFLDYYTNSIIYFGLGVLSLLMMLMSSRIIFAFTRNARPDLLVVNRELLDILFNLLVVVFIGTLLIFGQGPIVTLSGVGLFCAGIARLEGWKMHKVFDTPLLFILHLGFFWIMVGVGLIALNPLVDMDLIIYAVHAITIGGLGSLTLGMMTRSTLGHTGRTLKESNLTFVLYVLINLSAFVRIFPDMVWPEFHQSYVYYSALFWALAFLLFIIEYTPMLTKKRVMP
jgi:uncharacterized protein involved in response to NO